MTNLAKSDQKNLRLCGIAASPGIVIAEVYLLDRQRVAVIEYQVGADAVDSEIELFENAVSQAKEQLIAVKENLSQKSLREHFYIIDTQLMILDDQMLHEATINLIKNKGLNASGALKRVLQQFRQTFDSIEDEYLRERGSDIEIAGERILRNIGGKEQPCISNLEQRSVVVAHDLSPADTLQLDKKKAVAFITDLGGRTSHTAILARSLEIPAVIGLENVTSRVYHGAVAIVDGCSGCIIINPCEKTIDQYLAKKKRYELYRQKLQEYCELPAQTSDGKQVSLKANIEFPGEAELAIHNGASGIGLLRTEFMYIARQQAPSEEDQFLEYSRIIQEVAPHSVTIRTLDVGGDKFVPNICLDDEANPAMGLRSVRLSLREMKLFRAQIRAILRASALGDVRILFPMISGVAEVRACRTIVNEVMDELKTEGVDFDPELDVGIMIETPSAVLVADLLASEVDFFSVGSNDLIQYCLAVDRGNEHVAYLYEPYHPAILRALFRVATAAELANIPACICGELASDPIYSALLIAMGYSELSMNSSGISRVKKLLRQWHSEDGKRLLESLLQLDTAAGVASAVAVEMKKYSPDFEPNVDFNLN
ncbi:MAG: phosphoenolpyruvate--protein phosphotransferase [Desulfobacteraceae bacterium 4572_35.1]|nr:MAG: phosphoenolpyruvate--protein phosphotransferase [Desulfobacteraceae bacterium 4572_35.1]